jgi:hypothetical protein
VSKRLAIDQLRSARVCRESYVAGWLRGPVVDDGGDDLEPSESGESSDTASEERTEGPEGPHPETAETEAGEGVAPERPELRLAEFRSGPTPKRRSSNRTSASRTDPEARLRGKPGQRPHLVHRGQVAVDPKGGCVVACLGETADGHEGDALSPIVQRSRFACPGSPRWPPIRASPPSASGRRWPPRGSPPSCRRSGRCWRRTASPEARRSARPRRRASAAEATVASGRTGGERPTPRG